MDWYAKRHDVVIARSHESLFTELVTLYALGVLSQDIRFKEDYVGIYGMYRDSVKTNFVTEIYSVSLRRVERVCHRIIAEETEEETVLVESDVLQNNHPGLWNIMNSPNISVDLGDLHAIKGFYAELYSDDINFEYPRGRRNNMPWLNIVEKAINLERAQGNQIIMAIDALKYAVHNTGDSVIELMNDGEKLMEFFNTTANSDSIEELRYYLSYVDTTIVSRRDLGASFRGIW